MNKTYDDNEVTVVLSEEERSFLADLLSHDGDVLGELAGPKDLILDSLRNKLHSDEVHAEEIASNQRTINAAKEALEGWHGVKEISSDRESDLQDCITDLFHLAEAWHRVNGDFPLTENVLDRAWDNFWAERPTFNYDEMQL